MVDELPAEDRKLLDGRVPVFGVDVTGRGDAFVSWRCKVPSYAHQGAQALEVCAYVCLYPHEAVSLSVAVKCAWKTTACFRSTPLCVSLHQTAFPSNAVIRASRGTAHFRSACPWLYVYGRSLFLVQSPVHERAQALKGGLLAVTAL